MDYMTTAEVADLLRTTSETVRYWRHVKSGPKHFKAGRRVLYDRAEVERWIRGKQEQPVEQLDS